MLKYFFLYLCSVIILLSHYIDNIGGHRGRNHMVVGCIKVVSSNHTHSEAYAIQHYVIKFVSDLRRVGGFLHQTRTEILLKMALNKTTLTHNMLFIFIYYILENKKRCS